MHSISVKLENRWEEANDDVGFVESTAMSTIVAFLRGLLFIRTVIELSDEFTGDLSRYFVGFVCFVDGIIYRNNSVIEIYLREINKK